MKIDPGEPAFPSETSVGYHLGVTVREHFAAMAMQGMLAGRPQGGLDESISKKVLPTIAKISVEFADALIAELNK